MLFSRCSLLTGVEASAAQTLPVTKTCLQCGAVLPSSVRACNFCDSAFSVGPFPGMNRRTFPRGRLSRRTRVLAQLGLLVPSSASSSHNAWSKTLPGEVNSLSVSRLIALGGAGSRQTLLSLIFLSKALPAKRRRTLPLHLRNFLDPFRKIFPLPSRLAALQRRGFSKNHGW